MNKNAITTVNNDELTPNLQESVINIPVLETIILTADITSEQESQINKKNSNGENNIALE